LAAAAELDVRRAFADLDERGDSASEGGLTTRTNQGIKVYVDSQSTKLLQGAEIDYVDTLMGAGFTVNNPNAVSGCGCGSSFRTEESAGSPGGCSH
jgi:iron-sulfur cluster assembly protein